MSTYSHRLWSTSISLLQNIERSHSRKVFHQTAMGDICHVILPCFPRVCWCTPYSNMTWPSKWLYGCDRYWWSAQYVAIGPCSFLLPTIVIHNLTTRTFNAGTSQIRLLIARLEIRRKCIYSSQTHFMRKKITPRPPGVRSGRLRFPLADVEQQEILLWHYEPALINGWRSKEL